MSNAQTNLNESLVCPIDRTRLRIGAGLLVCDKGHSYPLVQGIPVVLVPNTEQTIGIAKASLRAAEAYCKNQEAADLLFIETLGITGDEQALVGEQVSSGRPGVDPVVQFMVGATNGILYRELIGHLDSYPIPVLRLPPGGGRRLLDVGCNWGRWVVAAARAGYKPVGIDPSLGAILAARRVCQQLEVDAGFVVGDARYLPFADASFDTVFSYSVIQHFSPENAKRAFSEVGRVLVPGGNCLVQMANFGGVRCLYHQMRRGFRTPAGFEVRYWRMGALRRAVQDAIGPVRFTAEGFLGIGLQPSDAPLLPFDRRLVLRISEALRACAGVLPPLLVVADSIYVAAVKPPARVDLP